MLHIITRLVRGGADENTLHTVYGLDSKMFEVDLLFGRDSEPDEMALETRPNVSYLLFPDLRREINPVLDIMALWKLYVLMRKRKYHIVHTHTAKAGLLGRIAAFCARTPVTIHSLHGATFGDFVSPIKRELYVALEKIGTAVCDSIICVGEDLKQRYIQKKIGRAEKYCVIYSGMKLAPFYEASNVTYDEKLEIKIALGIDSSALIVGNISRLESRKGHLFFIEAAKKILRHNPNVKFLIIGDGDSRKSLERKVKKMGLENDVLFVGFRKDIARIISILDVSVLTSLWEGLPRVLVQSAAAGKPIVSFAVEGVTEVVKEGTNGFVVESMSVESLADKISWLLENPISASKMGLSGQKIIGDRWELTTMVREIQSLYVFLLSQKKIK